MVMGRRQTSFSGIRFSVARLTGIEKMSRREKFREI
jgi:hypothetical protein